MEHEGRLIGRAESHMQRPGSMGPSQLKEKGCSSNPEDRKLFQEWGEMGLKESGGGGESKYDIFDTL